MTLARTGPCAAEIERLLNTAYANGDTPTRGALIQTLHLALIELKEAPSSAVELEVFLQLSLYYALFGQNLGETGLLSALQAITPDTYKVDPYTHILKRR